MSVPRETSQALERLAEALDWLHDGTGTTSDEQPPRDGEAISRAIVIRWQVVEQYTPPRPRDDGTGFASLPPFEIQKGPIKLYFVDVPVERHQSFQSGERWFDTLEAALADAALDVIEAAQRREAYAHRRVQQAMSAAAKVEQLLGVGDGAEDRVSRTG